MIRRLPRVSIARIGLALVLSMAAVACTSGPSAGPSGAPTGNPAATPAATATAEPEPRAELVIGCLGIEAAECRFLAERVVNVVPAGRGAPFAVEIFLFPCENVPAPCPRTLAFRSGKAIVEFLDGGEPIELSLKGPPQATQIVEQDAFDLGLTNPSSPRVGGVGPFPFDIGHCGISHVIDFDGSFWLPVGQVDGDNPTIINSESGAIRLLAPNVAEFRGDSGFTVQLARFPGPKHFWGCD